MNFLVVNDIDIHQLNLRPFKNLQFLVENTFKECGFLHFLSNKCITSFFFGGGDHYFKKKDNSL
jgi:hypothetical protein